MYTKFGETYIQKLRDAFVEPTFVQAFLEELIRLNVTWTQLCLAIDKVGGGCFLGGVEDQLKKECPDLFINYAGCYKLHHVGVFHVFNDSVKSGFCNDLSAGISALSLHDTVDIPELSALSLHDAVPQTTGVLTTTPVDPPGPYKLPTLTI
jgi:hypothetical protein